VPLRGKSGVVSPVCRGEQGVENDGFAMWDQFDPGLGGTVGITEQTRWLASASRFGQEPITTD
jgi:hypothetical protein